MSETGYHVIAPEKGVPIKAWTKGVALEVVHTLRQVVCVKG